MGRVGASLLGRAPDRYDAGDAPRGPMWSYDEESVMPRFKLRLLQLLNRNHYRQARDPLMGDETPSEGITAWREQLPGAPAIDDAAYVPVVDRAYREFHRRQVHELEALGERRVVLVSANRACGRCFASFSGTPSVTQNCGGVRCSSL